MITFRFYIVSVVAFFLALAVGVVLGSALDGRISDSLKDRLERVESNLDSTVDLIDQKNDKIDALSDFASASLPFSVEGRLSGTNTLIVAQSGIDENQVADLVAAVRQAGSTTPGVLWVDKSWDLKSREFISRAQKSIGESAQLQSGDKAGERIWLAVLASLGLPGPESTTSTTTTTVEGSATTVPTGATTLVPESTSPSTVVPPGSWWEQPLIEQLAQNSVMRLESIGEIGTLAPATSLNVIAVIGPDSEVANGASGVASLVRAAQVVGLPMLIAEMNSSADSQSVDNDSLKQLLDTNGLTNVSTVQSADEVAGRVASIIALQQAVDGVYGNYGRGSLASSLLPKPKAPDGGS